MTKSSIRIIRQCLFKDCNHNTKSQSGYCKAHTYAGRSDYMNKYFQTYYKTGRAKLRRMASAFINNRIARLEIEKLPCEVCGIYNSEAHHKSYDQSEFGNVSWLCRKHHQKWHKENKAFYPLTGL